MTEPTAAAREKFARENFDRLLGELESERPLQFMTTLSLVTQTNYAPPGQAAPTRLLDLHFTLSGYLRGNADKQPVTAAEFSTSKQDRLPRMRALLHDVYEHLPPDAVLEFLDAGLQPNHVRLVVLAADAPACIASLQQSRMLADATMQGPIEPDVRVKKDRFVVALKIRDLP